MNDVIGLVADMLVNGSKVACHALGDLLEERGEDLAAYFVRHSAWSTVVPSDVVDCLAYVASHMYWSKEELASALQIQSMPTMKATIRQGLTRLTPNQIFVILRKK